MNWEEIDKISNKYNDVFVSFSDIGTESRLKFWLPAKIINEPPVAIKLLPYPYNLVRQVMLKLLFRK